MITFTVELNIQDESKPGKKDVQVQLPDGSTIKNLIDKLQEMYPERGKEPLFADFSIDGNHASRKTVIPDGCRIYMVFPMGGG